MAIETQIADGSRRCANCGSMMEGQYCSRCGQRDKLRMISLWELIRDLVGDLFELDSRLWRTLFPLLFRPGVLTREYLKGRRVHYSPPLRMYLVLSLVFFLVAGLGGIIESADGTVDGKDAITFSFDDDDATDSAAAAGDGSDVTDVEPDAGGGDVRVVGADDGTAGDNGAATGREDTDKLDSCDDIKSPVLGFESPALAARMKRTCERLTTEGGMSAFASRLVDNLPAMMFVFLPLIAIVMKGLYLGSRRYYVEHLLFFVHYHSFFFLAVSLTILFGMLPDALPGHGVVYGLLIAALTIWLPVYLFRAMRVVYGQGRLVTFLKYFLLLFSYLVSLLVTFLFGAVATALMV